MSTPPLFRERRMRYAIPSWRCAIRLLAPSVVISSGIPSLNLATLIAARTLPREKRPKIVLREGAVPSMARHDPSCSNWIAYQILRHLYHYADRVVTVISMRLAAKTLAEHFRCRRRLFRFCASMRLFLRPWCRGWSDGTGKAAGKTISSFASVDCPGRRTNTHYCVR